MYAYILTVVDKPNTLACGVSLYIFTTKFNISVIRGLLSSISVVTMCFSNPHNT